MAMPAYVMGFVFLAIFDYTGPIQSWWRWMFGAKAWFPDIASYGGVVLVMTLVLYPYVYMLARAAFRLVVLSWRDVDLFVAVNIATGAPLTSALMAWSFWYARRALVRAGVAQRL